MTDRADERRKHPRVPLSIDGRWQGPGAASLCKMADLSLGGCFARTTLSPAVNEQILVTLFFGGHGTMVLPGLVTRAESGVGFGMQFRGLGSDDRFRLSEEIARILRSRPSRPPQY